MCQAVVLAAMALGAAQLSGGRIGPAHVVQEKTPDRLKPVLQTAAGKVRAERYEIDVAFEPERSFLRAKASVTLRAAEYTEATEFELNPKLKVLEITDAQGRKLTFDRSRRMGSPKLLVRLAEPCGAEQSVTLTFVYEGTLPRGELDYITAEGILLRDEARWYPAVDLAAFTQNRISITVPSRWQAISSGGSNSTGAGLSATYAWTTQRPVSSRSIVALSEPTQTHCVPSPVSMGSYSKLEPMSACLQAAGTRESDALLLKNAHVILNSYGQLLGPYADYSLRFVQGFPGATGAIGYSAPGFLVVSEDVIKYHDHPGYAPEFLPHEMAHQWFPIEVTLASPEDGWLAESLAEYLAWRYLLEKEPEQARLMVARAMRDGLAPEPLRPLKLGLRLFGQEEWHVTHATLYERGLLVFRTLETVIGRDRLSRAIRTLYQRHRGRSASIGDFRKTCEETSGRDLGWFFDYFLDGTEIPEIELRRLPSPAPNEVMGEVLVRNVPPEFSVRVEMRAETERGSVEHSVATQGEVTPFTFTTPAPATRLTLDPDARILRWTEAARRNRNQQRPLAKIAELERSGQLEGARRAARQALALDPENLASNQQQIYFQLGRLEYRLGRSGPAWRNFERVLALGSLEPMADDFYRVWARVYRARIARRQGRLAAARDEVKAGLAMYSPALHTQIRWAETQRESSAAAELRALAANLKAPVR